jgi:hypothetical protein
MKRRRSLGLLWPELRHSSTHQVNALLMSPSGYITWDSLKTGDVMTNVFIAVAVTMMYLIMR